MGNTTKTMTIGNTNYQEKRYQDCNLLVKLYRRLKYQPFYFLKGLYALIKYAVKRQYRDEIDVRLVWLVVYGEWELKANLWWECEEVWGEDEKRIEI
jgi:hypothetical protein